MTIGHAPNRIDIMTTIDAVSFDHAWENRLRSTYGGIEVNYIGKDDLIANKIALDRPQDRADVAYLLESEPDPQT